MTDRGATRYGLPLTALRRIAVVVACYPEIRLVKVFGSRAKGNYRSGSDLDLCIDAPGLSLASRLALENQLDDLLLPWKIDIVLLDTINNPALLDHIDRAGIAFSAN